MQNQPNEISCLWLQEPSSFLRRFKANLSWSCFSPIIFRQFFGLYFSFQQHYSVLTVFILLFFFCILSQWEISSEPFISKNKMPRNPILIKIRLCFTGTSQPVQLSPHCTELIINQSEACILFPLHVVGMRRCSVGEQCAVPPVCGKAAERQEDDFSLCFYFCFSDVYWSKVNISFHLQVSVSLPWKPFCLPLLMPCVCSR